MTKEQAAAWLKRAERELQEAQAGLDGSLRAIERYRAARADLVNAQNVGLALLWMPVAAA